ncbi:MAG: glutathione S-transferase, partial [Xanthobacteraceae bacterium]
FTRRAGTIVFPKRFLPKDRWNSGAMAEARAEIERHLAILETHLAGKKYLVAEQYSLADLCYAPFLEFLPLDGNCPSKDCRGMDRTADKPELAKSVPEHSSVLPEESLVKKI